MIDHARFLRQVMLKEIGEAGQRRIGEARAAVSGPTPAHAVASRYALAAGFASITEGPVDRDALAPPSIVTTPAARDVLAGSRAALGAIRAAIQGDFE